MSSDLLFPALFPREQFRMSRLQVFNWGTFSGYYDIPIAERGFLFVGRSGAGKSTLLDAFSALLIPPRWIDFNAAAREADRSGRDRNLVTYIRGAWAEQKDGDSGEIATQYLRKGTTWSALALTYNNPAGQTVVLVQLFWLRGNSNGNTDVKRHYFIFEQALDLRQLSDFPKSNFDLRKLKNAFPDAFARDEFRPYCERFCRLLGIASEMALRLLHKTQSAKNLGDLNTFLRDFMLEKPETFEVAERLVNEFGELNSAHQSVVTAREQVQTLSPAREQHQHMTGLQEQKNRLDEWREGATPYRDARWMTLLGDHITGLEVVAEGLAGEERSQQEELNNRATQLRHFEQQHRELGGDQLEQWEIDLRALEDQKCERLRKRGQAEEACRRLSSPVPTSPHDFAALVGKARLEMEQWKLQTTREEQITLGTQLAAVKKEFAQAVSEVNALRRQPSNIPAGMLELRRQVAEAIGLSEGALPFAGELLEVKSEEGAWQGAIERVLHGFALSLLVDERHYSALTGYLNGVDLRQRLVYYRMNRPDEGSARPINPQSMIFKVKVKAGPQEEWLQAYLRQYFDYVCVQSGQEFRNAERALTREGQIKHNRTRHEKDDRTRIDDRRHWVLGFDNREKLALYEKQAQDLGETIAGLERRIRQLSEQDLDRATRAMHCQTLVNLQWQEIDVASLATRISSLEKQLRQAREGNTPLQQISESIKRQKGLVDRAEVELRTLRVKREKTLDQIKDDGEKLAALRQSASGLALPWHVTAGLDERFARLQDAVRLDNLDRLTTSVIQSLGREIESLNREVAVCEKFIETRFADFKRQWPMEAGDMDASLASAQDFFAKLQRLESDGLPAHEQRFFELLQNQSHQNLAALSTHLTQARKAILERMTLVNESLRQADFNPGTHLQIEASDRQLQEVRDFKGAIQKALSHAWNNDREAAESRFGDLRALVEQLASQEPEKRRWREAVLDVRLHVEFIGRELDQGGVEVEVYRSGAGKSGGQRQKLATTCLAAALRYQLGGDDHGVPLYAPVIMDEAFDKADNEFTALAMNIFTNFGFQMIVATPLKSVMTLEPFIGGACFVDISDRRVSGVLLIEYDTAGQRLKLPEQAREEAALETS